MARTAAQGPEVIRAQRTLRRLSRVTREAGRALKALERVDLDDVYGTFRLAPGEGPEDGFLEFLSHARAEYPRQDLVVTIRAQSRA